MMQPYTYLALGDSYTIGEQVPLTGSFPYQAVQLLRQQGVEFHAPEIVAVTGYTTDELLQLMQGHSFLKSYDLVSLLIGVNNQYRNRPVESFQPELDALLEKAIAFAGGNCNHVFVLSIPDWGVTPFAADRDIPQIAAAIDAYNDACRKAALAAGCNYIDITTAQRADSNDATFLAADRLHPSAKEYFKWANLLSEQIAGILTKDDNKNNPDE